MVTREHSPRPGRRWETAARPVEVVVPDDAPDPRPNRAARRALKRRRKAGAPAVPPTA